MLFIVSFGIKEGDPEDKYVVINIFQGRKVPWEKD